jgi:GTPase SAR1 family protein
MNCDGGIHDKLDKYELTRFLNQHSMNLFLGPPRSGKTSLLYSFFKSSKILKNCFHTIYVFQPKQSRASMQDKIFDTLPEDQLYDELSYDNLSEVMDRIRLDADEGFNSAILFDDQSAYLKNKDTMRLFKELVWNRRHLHVSCFFCVQSWFAVPKELRRVWTNAFIFKVNKQQLNDIWEEIIEKPKDLVDKIRKLVYDKPHQYLFINVDNQRIFKCWDEIILDDESDNEDI